MKSFTPHSFPYLRQPCFWERKLWSEISFLLLCWRHYLLSSQVSLATDMYAGYRTTWFSPYHISSASCHPRQPPSHTCNHHHIYCYFTALSFYFFHSSFPCTVARDCLEWQRATERKSGESVKGILLACCLKCVFVHLNSNMSAKITAFLYFASFMWKHGIK